MVTVGRGGPVAVLIPSTGSSPRWQEAWICSAPGGLCVYAPAWSGTVFRLCSACDRPSCHGCAAGRRRHCSRPRRKRTRSGSPHGSAMGAWPASRSAVKQREKGKGKREQWRARSCRLGQRSFARAPEAAAKDNAADWGLATALAGAVGALHAVSRGRAGVVVGSGRVRGCAGQQGQEVAGVQICVQILLRRAGKLAVARVGVKAQRLLYWGGRLQRGCEELEGLRQLRGGGLCATGPMASMNITPLYLIRNHFSAFEPCSPSTLPVPDIVYILYVHEVCT